MHSLRLCDIQVNSEIDDAIKYFYVPETRLSPLRGMHVEPETATMDQIDAYEFGGTTTAGDMQLQSGDGDNYISEFLNSVLNPEVYSEAWNSTIPLVEGLDCNNIDGLSFNNVLKKENVS